MNDIVVRGLKLELEQARKRLRSALWEVGHKLADEPALRANADVAVRRIEEAAAYYDNVQLEIQRAESARIFAFNEANNSYPPSDSVVQ